MQTFSAKLVTIMAESVLEEQLVAELHELGAVGHTIVSSHGAGSRHIGAGDPPGDGIRVEVVASPAVADRILDHLAARYFPHYAVIAFVADVQVVRGEKYR